MHTGPIYKGAFLLGTSIFPRVDRDLPDECPLIEDPRQANLIQYALNPSIGVYESPKWATANPEEEIQCAECDLVPPHVSRVHHTIQLGSAARRKTH